MKVILILSSIFLLSACKNASRNVQPQRDIAAAVQTSVDSQSDYFKQIANRMDLYIPTVKDSFMLRLWINSIIEPDHVIELRKNGTYWETRKYIYYFEPDGRLMFKEVPLELLSTRKPMIDSLHKVNFNNLISQERIKGFQDNVADGVAYNMEIFQSGRYKILVYHCPESYYSKEENNRKFVDILMLLDKHFMFYSPICKRG